MGDGGARDAAREASRRAEQTQQLLAQQAAEQRAQAAKDAEKAQRLMMRSLRGGGGGFYIRPANNPVLNDASGVLG